MSVIAYVVDTNYLCELFKVGGKCSYAGHAEVKSRFKKGVQAKARFYVPLPCIFELGNHIAQISKGDSRKKIAKALCAVVKTSIEGNGPWIIKPSEDIHNTISRLCDVFSQDFVQQQIGLTDSFAISEASHLKKKYKNDYKVHIWTTDSSLKSREPDKEPNPYTG
ncbi:hypothetical protein Dalk_0114 [Desulfatibacillum aliphaticivorans]|uniref:PIN domain-containing protein n=1 Tax=Desulfatibacillum aliphaticivorans TaxID=218208 RepID=B8FKK9_DESAL|nr:hypothetical protein [Desulfatibacillum aliphaticivorans]ACL01824.1 hypothetical protein Dalk_0114 [Desulfatibacillum aliphaticivorans]